MKRLLGTLGCVLLFGAILAGCDDVNMVSRPGHPVVLTGADFLRWSVTAPGQIVAFRHTRTARASRRGRRSPCRSTSARSSRSARIRATTPAPAATGTVYGSGSGGPTALQYADPEHMGRRRRRREPSTPTTNSCSWRATPAAKCAPEEATTPAGVIAGTRRRRAARRSAGRRPPGLGVSVPQHQPRRRARGRTTSTTTSSSLAATTRPPTSATPVPTRRRRRSPRRRYRIAFTDRWYETAWQVGAGGATGRRHPRRAQEPVRDRQLRPEQQDLRRRRGRVRGQHRWSGARDPLVHRGEQRPEDAAHPPDVPRHGSHRDRPSRPRDPGDDGLRRLQRGGDRHDLPLVGRARRGNHRRHPRRVPSAAPTWEAVTGSKGLSSPRTAW